MYVPSTSEKISSYDVVFDESFSSALAYTSRPYLEEMAMRPAVTYTLYATSSKEQTGDVITFAQFEEGNILTKTRNNADHIESSPCTHPCMELQAHLHFYLQLGKSNF